MFTNTARKFANEGTALEDENLKLRERVRQLEAEVDQGRVELADSQEQLQSKTKECLRRDGDVAYMVNRNRERAKKINIYKSRAEELEHANAQLGSDNEKLTSDNANIEARMNTIKSENAKLLCCSIA